MRRGALVVLLSVTTAARAQAFVRKVNEKTDVPTFWNKSCVSVTVYLNGFDKSQNQYALTVAGIMKSVTEAAHTWSGDVVACPAGDAPYLEIVPTLAPVNAPAPSVADDAKNVIVFRTDRWPSDHDPSALAVTSVTSEGDGHISDVDMEINATSSTMRWMNFDPGFLPPADQHMDADYYDLQNALTHEFGHFIGLDHTCFKPDRPGSDVSAKGALRPTDDRGARVPDCGPLTSPPDVQATVMYDVSSPGEVSKRTLSPDDVSAVCAIYAPSRPHEKTCALDKPPVGCEVAGTSTRGSVCVPSAACAVALLVEAARRRRRRVSDPRRARV
ncbi:MAG TPA: hypothetical protein VGK52_11180 [Polyangia bacterium]